MSASIGAPNDPYVDRPVGEHPGLVHTGVGTTTVGHTVGTHAHPRSGVSWAAIFAGATVATAVTVMLVALGSGIGLASASPTTTGTNPSAATFTVLAAIWLIVVQWVSSFFGGYLAGRLRPGWDGIHANEVGFRDTAAGFTAWAVASLFVIGMVSSGAGSMLGGLGSAVGSAAHTAATAAGGSGSSSGDPSGYLLDTLFRPQQPNPQQDTASAKVEAGRILATGATGPISQSDHDYLVQLVTARTGLSSQDASTRVDSVIGQEQQAVQKAKQAANAARKAVSGFSIYTFFSMLIGAFIASVAAAIGGRQRDHY